MSRPLVSAIMAAYNAEPFLAPAIESVLRQDYEPFEFILVDDGSDDRTVEIAAGYDGVRIHRQARGGPAKARNTGITHSSGKFVTTFDADDLWPANRLSLQVAHLEAHTDVGVVLGRQEWLNPPAWFTRDAVFGDLDGIPLNTAMFRRGVLDQLGGFDESFRHSEDMDLLVRVREAGIGLSILPEILCYRRYHGGQLTANVPETPPILRSLREKLQRERAADSSEGSE